MDFLKGGFVKHGFAKDGFVKHGQRLQEENDYNTEALRFQMAAARFLDRCF